MTNNIIGHARTIQTAILVVEYLRQRHGGQVISKDAIQYRFNEPSSENGYWSADIMVVWPHPMNAVEDEVIEKMILSCRAFVAGRGEIWT